VLVVKKLELDFKKRDGYLLILLLKCGRGAKVDLA
jgi:hypothetical protein